LLAVLQECDWNRREAARRLGVSEGTIRARIKRFNLVESHVK
jgi:transcriptional regulator of acetoin/glycerol metabolism